MVSQAAWAKLYTMMLQNTSAFAFLACVDAPLKQSHSTPHRGCSWVTFIHSPIHPFWGFLHTDCNVTGQWHILYYKYQGAHKAGEWLTLNSCPRQLWGSSVQFSAQCHWQYFSQQQHSCQHDSRLRSPRHMKGPREGKFLLQLVPITSWSILPIIDCVMPSHIEVFPCIFWYYLHKTWKD